LFFALFVLVLVLVLVIAGLLRLIFNRALVARRALTFFFFCFFFSHCPMD